MTDDIQLQTATSGSPEHERIVQMIEIFRASLAACEVHWTDPMEASFVMTAASMFAGSVFGTLIATGVAEEKDKRRITESMAHNFREGIKAGKLRAERIRAETIATMQ